MTYKQNVDIYSVLQMNDLTNRKENQDLRIIVCHCSAIVEIKPLHFVGVMVSGLFPVFCENPNSGTEGGLIPLKNDGWSHMRNELTSDPNDRRPPYLTVKNEDQS